MTNVAASLADSLCMIFRLYQSLFLKFEVLTYSSYFPSHVDYNANEENLAVHGENYLKLSSYCVWSWAKF